MFALIIDCAVNFVTVKKIYCLFSSCSFVAKKLAYFCPVWHILKHNLSYFVFIDLATLVDCDTINPNTGSRSQPFIPCKLKLKNSLEFISASSSKQKKCIRKRLNQRNK